VIAHPPQHRDEQHQGHRSPRHLAGGIRGRDGFACVEGLGRRTQVQPVDHHQAQAVEQGRTRQDQWIGVGGQPAHRPMRQSEKPQIRQTQIQQRPGQVLVLLGFHQDQRQRDHTSRKHQQSQLNATTGGHRQPAHLGSLTR
jgi:hypothetical protein